MYADDTALICTADNVFELQTQTQLQTQELKKISQWFFANRLTVNANKTKYIIFHSRRKLISYEDIQIKIDNCILERTDTFKYLGIILDNHFHWAGQINAVSVKLASGCHALLQARGYFDKSILRALYFAFINSHLTYCMESWAWTYDSYLDPLRRLQKRAIRIISHSNHNEPSRPLFRSLKILPFDLLREYKTTVCVNSIVKYNNPFDVSLFYSSSRPTRSLTFGNFNLAPRNNVYGERLLQFKGIKIWNSLPTELKSSHNAAVKLKNQFMIRL